MRKKQFKKQFGKLFPRNFMIGIGVIGIVIIFMAGYYFHAVSLDFDNECSYCTTAECNNTDGLCGDFGIYWMKFVVLSGLTVFGISLLHVSVNSTKRGKNTWLMQVN